MNISEKAAYIKGMAEMMGVDESKPEGKIMKAVIELLGDLAHEIEDLNENAMDLAEEIDQLSDDLADVEEALDDCCCMNDECCCDDDDCCCKDDDCCCDEDDEPVFYEITCPKCGENLEFEFDTDEDEGCCCGKSDKE